MKKFVFLEGLHISSSTPPLHAHSVCCRGSGSVEGCRKREGRGGTEERRRNKDGKRGGMERIAKWGDGGREESCKYSLYTHIDPSML